MARSIVLSILCVFTAACNHSDGIRVEWAEVPRTAPAETDLVVEVEEPTVPDEDGYALVMSAYSMDPTDGRFILQEPDIDVWQTRLRSCSFELEIEPD